MSPDYLPAKIQLAQDLLRLGKEEMAWELVEEVHASDAYHVVAFNLATLRDEMKKFATLTSENFILRMTEREAGIYGERALEILEEAHEVLNAKYRVSVDEPVLVEFFPSQQDFAVRTLGVPGGGGLLGVCFGSVITMNSPGSMAHGMNNWEATLWHEYCHVVTLRLTQNKMSRWFSEGISLYEELQRNPNWGQHMTPRYREMILEEDKLRPVSAISTMFMNPESGEDLMFAYFESGMVVEYLMGKFGIDPMRKVLAALGRGDSFEAAAREHFVGMEKLDRDFARHAVNVAKGFGKGVDWSRPEGLDPYDGEALARYLKAKPKNFHAMGAYVGWLLEEERWKDAAQWGEKLRKLYPDDRDEMNAHVLLAKAYRELGELKKERAVLRELAGLSADATPAMLRLLELETDEEAWVEGGESARAIMAVNPFLGRPHYFLGRASEAAGERETAVEAYEVVLKLGAEKPAEVHYRLAELVRGQDPEAARRHALDALVEAPRYRKAHGLLEELAGVSEPEPVPVNPAAAPSSTPVTPPATPPMPEPSPAGIPFLDPKPQPNPAPEPEPEKRARRSR
jgi:tetratricopeptide (TPR) repeat protein